MTLIPAAVAAAPDLGTTEGFTAWVAPHWAAMAALAGRYGADPDDILQDALAAAWRKRAQFDPARGSAHQRRTGARDVVAAHDGRRREHEQHRALGLRV